MMVESLRALLRAPDKPLARRKHRSAEWMAAMPFAMRFRRSQLYISPIPPIVLGFLVGLLASIMGVGGGFIMVPAMLYILNMPTNVVIGTSLFQIIFVTAIATVLHAAANQTVDVVLALLLLTGGVIGAQIGARAGRRLKANNCAPCWRLSCSAFVQGLLFGLVTPPASPFVLETLS